MTLQNVAQPICNAPAQKDATMTPPAFRYSAVRFLQVMVTIAWSALAHPFTSSVIDLTTGQVYTAEEE